MPASRCWSGATWSISTTRPEQTRATTSVPVVAGRRTKRWLMYPVAVVTTTTTAAMSKPFMGPDAE